MVETTDFKNYIGDVNIEYGGLFVNLENWHDGYADCLRITDLDSACGFNSAVLIEEITVYCDNPDDIRAALSCCGWSEGLPGRDSDTRKLLIIDALASYGFCDVDTYYSQPWIVITDPDEDYAPIEFDGWKADYRLREDQSLIEYLAACKLLDKYE